MDTTAPVVSVVVPTYNRLNRLQLVLAALARQTYPADHLEIIVVSDGSTDGTDEYLRLNRSSNVEFVSQPNGGPAVARNHGIDLARGSIIVFIDDDVIATPRLIEHHAASHQDGGDGQVVIGPMLSPSDFSMTPWIRWEQAMLYKQYAAMERGDYAPTSRQFYTGNASVSRANLTSVGVFDPRFRRGEDVELAYRLEDAGLRFTFNREAIGYHYAERTFESWLQNGREYGANDVIFAREGRSWVLARLAEEFRHRHYLARLTTRACLSQPWLESLMQPFLTRIATAGDRVHAERLVRQALSGLYHVAYYRGVADELGGATTFRDLINGGVGAVDVVT